MISNFTSLDAFGILTTSRINDSLNPTDRARLEGHEIKKIAAISNIRGILSYLPIIGTIVGIVTLVLMSKPNAFNFTPEFLKTCKARAIINTLSLGFLFLIPDIIISIGRAISNSNRPAPQPNNQEANEMLEQALDGSRTPKARLDMMEEAVKNGADIDFFKHVEAIINAAEMYRNGSVEGEIEKDIDKAIYWSKVGIKNHFAYASNVLADIYIDEEAIMEDPQDVYNFANEFSDRSRRRFQLMQIAAEAGHVGAMFEAGKISFYGNGSGVEENRVEKNVEQAIGLFEQAAELGNIQACTELANIYLFGDIENNISKDINMGGKYLLMAFKNGGKNISLAEKKTHTVALRNLADKKAAITFLRELGVAVVVAPSH